MKSLQIVTHRISRAIIWRGNSILLARNVGDNTFYFPGGHVEPGESPLEALVRELKEELGWDRMDFDFVCEVPNHWGDSVSCNIEANFIFALKSALSLDVEATSQESTLEFIWVPFSIAHSLPVLPRAILEKAFEIQEKLSPSP